MSGERQTSTLQDGQQTTIGARPPARWISITILTLTLALAGGLPAGATVLAPLTVADLTRHADVVIHGQVEAVQTLVHGRDRMPVTMVEIQVLEVMAGDLPPRRRITVTQPGGTAGGVALEYDGRPQFTMGQQVVLFLARRAPGRFITVGLAQGKYEVGAADAQGRRKLTRTLHGAALATPASEPLPEDLAALRRRIQALPRDLTGTRP